MEAEDDIPDDFFDDLADNKFLDELLENVETDEGATKTNNDDSPNEETRSNSPLVERCLKEIDKLTKDIQRKKKKLQKELQEKERDTGPLNSPNPRRSKSPTKRSKSPRRQSSYRPRNRSRSNDRRSREYQRPRSRSRTSPRRRRTRSRSPFKRRRTPDRLKPSDRNSTKAMSFLEELNMKFAEQGQPFPEKDLLLAQNQQQQRNQSYNQALVPNPMAMTSGYIPQPYQMMPQIPAEPQQQQFGYAGNYVPNPLAFNQPGMFPMGYNQNFITIPHTPQMPPQPSNIALPSMSIAPSTVASDLKIKTELQQQDQTMCIMKPAKNKEEVLSRCNEALKLLRAEENKVPKLRFLMTKTSMQQVNPIDCNTSALHNPNNVEFRKTSKYSNSVNSLQPLPMKTKDIVKSLGFNVAFVFSQMKMRELSNKVMLDLEDTHKQKIRKIEKPPPKTIECQTDEYKCDMCEERASIQYASRSTQVALPMKISMRTQTDDIDYRGPMLKMINLMTAAQLIAMQDFAKIIFCEKPGTAEEMFQLRERLMDTYNLGQRDQDAVKEAERKRRIEEERMEQAGRHSRYEQNSSGLRNPVNNRPVDSWDHGTGNQPQFWNKNCNIPPDTRMDCNPPHMLDVPSAPIIGDMNNMVDRDYNMVDRRRMGDDRLADLVEMEEMERERELRYQQAQYERDLRAFEAEESRILQDMQQQAARFEEEECQRKEAQAFNNNNWRGRNRGGGVNNFGRGRSFRGRFNR